jgi:prephenate dehydrogenase
MAGKEQPGIDAADPDLFQDRPWILTPPNGCIEKTPLASEYISWLKVCGAIPKIFTPEDHDRTVAWTSHVPQLLSTALASVLRSEIEENKVTEASGPGLRDMTRLALSPWPVWKDIVATNARSIDHALGVYIDKLTEMRENLQTQRTGEEFAIAAEIALRIRRGPQMQ